MRVQNEKEPIYDFTLEDLGRVNEQPVLPFNAYGTLAWARNEFENNSASSQVGEPSRAATWRGTLAEQEGMPKGEPKRSWGRRRRTRAVGCCALRVLVLPPGPYLPATSLPYPSFPAGVLPAQGERADPHRLKPAGRPLRCVWLHHPGARRPRVLQGAIARGLPTARSRGARPMGWAGCKVPAATGRRCCSCSSDLLPSLLTPRLPRLCVGSLQVGDKVEYIKVVDGAQNLKNVD